MTEWDKLEKELGIRRIVTEEDFDKMLGLPKVILYVMVDWSGPERASRAGVFKTLKQIRSDKVPVFIVDCSTQREDSTFNFAEQWLLDQNKEYPEFIYGGWGETLLIKEAKVVDFIKYPAHIGFEKTKDILTGWMG